MEYDEDTSNEAIPYLGVLRITQGQPTKQLARYNFIMVIVIGYLILIVSGLLFYFPSFMLNIKQNSPRANLGQVKRRYNFGAGFILVLVIYTMGHIILQEKTLGAKFFLLLVPFISGISLFDAIFFLVTDVYPLHVIERILLFQNEDTAKMTKVAVWQICIATVLSITALVLYFIVRFEE